VLRKLTFLSVLGFLAMVLLGPVLAILGVMLSFAVLGLVVWVPIRVLMFGRPLEWDRWGQTGKKYCGAVFRGCNRISSQFHSGGGVVLEKASAAGRFLGTILRETACGALVGAMLGLLQGAQGSFQPRTVGLGVLIGAGVGAFVALTSRTAVRETV
jgi:hypothetical protein